MKKPTNLAGSFPFASFDARGVEPIKKAFEKAGASVIEVVAPNRAARRAGHQVKTATFFLADGQQVMLLLKNDGDGNGDVYQVQLNKRVIPIKNVESITKAAAEIAGIINSNSPVFLQAERRKQAKLKIDPVDLGGGEKKKAPPVTNKAKLMAAKSEVSALEKQALEQEQILTVKQAELDARQEESKQIKSELETLLAENEQMEGAI